MPKEKRLNGIRKRKTKSANDVEIDKYLKFDKWFELNNEAQSAAFKIGFPEEDERLQFFENLIKYYEAIDTYFNQIDSALPRNKKHKRFREIHEWRNSEVFKKPRQFNFFAKKRVEEEMADLVIEETGEESEGEELENDNKLD